MLHIVNAVTVANTYITDETILHVDESDIEKNQ
jgi:hypothetical protein